jgi:hypothetical protein
MAELTMVNSATVSAIGTMVPDAINAAIQQGVILRHIRDTGL